APTPVVERAGDLVALDAALGEVTTHVSTVGVQHVEAALRIRPDDEFVVERFDGVWRAVTEIPGQSQTVPAACETCRGGCRVDRPYRTCVRCVGFVGDGHR